MDGEASDPSLADGLPTRPDWTDMTEPSQTQPTTTQWTRAFQIASEAAQYLTDRAAQMSADDELAGLTQAFGELSDDSDHMMAAQHILATIARFSTDGGYPYELLKDAQGRTLADYIDLTNALDGEDDTSDLDDLLPDEGPDSELWDFACCYNLLF